MSKHYDNSLEDTSKAFIVSKFKGSHINTARTVLVSKSFESFAKCFRENTRTKHKTQTKLLLYHNCGVDRNNQSTIAKESW